MILVDSSIWVDHFRATDAKLSQMLHAKRVLCHPFIIGEIMMGTPANRKGILKELRRLPEAIQSTDREVIDLVERHALYGLGIGYVDAHLIASLALTQQAMLWTRDRRMHLAAERINLASGAFS